MEKNKLKNKTLSLERDEQEIQIQEIQNKGKEEEVKITFPEFTDYKPYPVVDDIFNKYKEVDLNTEDKIKLSESDVIPEIEKGKKLNEVENVDQLDVPGSELDDAMEKIGSEDEENNYYSIGGDNHNDLEEDKRE